MANVKSATGTKKLTPKENHFARCVAGGMTYSDAYREAYNVQPGTKGVSVNRQAAKIHKREHVRNKVEQLIKQKEAGLVRAAVNDAERVRQFLREKMVDATPTDTNKIRAAELLGKDSGMFQPNTVTSDTYDNLTSNDIKEKLLGKLEQLLLSRSKERQPEPIDVTNYTVEQLDNNERQVVPNQIESESSDKVLDQAPLEGR